MEDVKKNYTTVSKIIDKKFGNNRYPKAAKTYETRSTRRGRVLHRARERWFRETLKTGSRVQIN
ncbi:unnamed protein product, partial [marine sediment metagenome]